jgi:O-antigen/teichoic acid export membrane protein
MSGARRSLVLVAGTATGQVAQLLWLVASSRTMTSHELGTMLSAQALYLTLQVFVDGGAWLYGARAASSAAVDDRLRGQITYVRLEFAALGAAGSIAFALFAGGAMPAAVLPYAVALLFFAALNTWEPFGLGRHGPYVAYLALRSITPGIVAWCVLAAGDTQAVWAPGVAELATLLTVTLVFRLHPLRAVRRALQVHEGPRRAIMRVTVCQTAAVAMVAVGTLTLTAAGAAAAAGTLGAGIKVMAGSATLIASGALGFFQSISRQHAHGAAGDTGGFARAVTTISWLTIVAATIAALAAPIVAAALLDDRTASTVTTLILVFAAIPAIGFVVALTSPLVARHEEGALLATYVGGFAIVSLGGLLVLAVAGPSAEGMAMALVLADLAMAIHVLPRARLLIGARARGIVLRTTGALGVTVAAAFLPGARPELLLALLLVSIVGLATACLRLVQRTPTDQPIPTAQLA